MKEFKYSCFTCKYCQSVYGVGDIWVCSNSGSEIIPESCGCNLKRVGFIEDSFF